MDVDRVVARDAEDARVRVQVLVERELEDRRPALPINTKGTQIVSQHARTGRMLHVPSDDGRIREEEDPDPIPALAVRLDHFLPVPDPVLVPPPDCRRVVHTEHVDVLHLEPGRLDLGHDPPERARRVRAREDVLVHEQAPDEVLVLPRRAEARDLEQENAVVVEQVVHLVQEDVVPTDADVLGECQ